jgi:hypothetical protein
LKKLDGRIEAFDTETEEEEEEEPTTNGVF